MAIRYSIASSFPRLTCQASSQERNADTSPERQDARYPEADKKAIFAANQKPEGDARNETDQSGEQKRVIDFRKHRRRKSWRAAFSRRAITSSAAQRTPDACLVEQPQKYPGSDRSRLTRPGHNKGAENELDSRPSDLFATHGPRGHEKTGQGVSVACAITRAGKDRRRPRRRRLRGRGVCRASRG